MIFTAEGDESVRDYVIRRPRNYFPLSQRFRRLIRTINWDSNVGIAIAATGMFTLILVVRWIVGAIR